MDIYAGMLFVIIVLLVIVIAMTARLAKRASNESDTPVVFETAAFPAGGPAGSAPPAWANPLADTELAAVIAAAIAAFEGSGGGSDSLIVRRISRVSGKGTTWNVAGRADCIESRKL